MHIEFIGISSHEEVCRVEDRGLGLTGFIAVHSTKLGPAAGGLRFKPYASEDDALQDVLKLSRGMTYKNAAAGLPLGGGKAVIMGEPAALKTPALLTAFGEAIERLNGRYWTAEDMGVGPADMDQLAQSTQFVAGRRDGQFASGDPSPVTARGVEGAIGIVARHAFGTADLTGRRVALQGLGNVGMHVARQLHALGAQLIVTDTNSKSMAVAANELDAVEVAPNDIYGVDADIFVPCAMGGILKSETIPLLCVRAVAGAANNQLATPADGDVLRARGVILAPDYVVNAGGVIQVATEILKIHDAKSFVNGRLKAMRELLDAILTESADRDVGPETVADEFVEQRFRDRAA